MTAFPLPVAGAIDGPVHRYALRVYYEDTDAGGVVYHANYLRWFERARSDMLELMGIDQAASLNAGEGAYAVAEASLRYLAPARLGDVVMIETRAGTVGRVSSTLLQSAWRGDTKLTEGVVRVGFIGPDGRPRRQPATWQKAFDAFAAAQETSSPEGQE